MSPITSPIIPHYQIFCANIRTAPYFAVAEAYRNWYDLDEKEVVALLQSMQ